MRGGPFYSIEMGRFRVSKSLGVSTQPGQIHVDLTASDLQPLFDDKPDCALLAPVLILSTDVGWQELEASADSEGECGVALERLGHRWRPSLHTDRCAGTRRPRQRWKPTFASAR